jgi:hypothetical protein
MKEAQTENKTYLTDVLYDYKIEQQGFKRDSK